MTQSCTYIIIICLLITIATIYILYICNQNKQLTQKIKTSETENKRLKHLSSAIGRASVLLLFDKNKELKYINKAFMELYNIDETTYRTKIGSSLSNYLKWSGYNENVEISEPATFIGRVKNNKGEDIWKQINIIPPETDTQNDFYYVVVEIDITNVKITERELQQHKKRSDELLHNMLPAEIVEELRVRGSASPRIYRSASVLFADIKNFTQWAESLSPKSLIDTLQELFSAFDDVVAENYIEKIKTIGDAYMCAGGLPMKNNSHPFDIVLAAFGIQNAVRILDEKQAKDGATPWLMRIGIHTGTVVAGVVGKTRTVYDIWGDTVNIASRLESACEPGRINISASTYEVIKDYFECEYRGKIMAKHKGEIDMFFVNRLKPEYSADEAGFTPNETFIRMLSNL